MSSQFNCDTCVYKKEGDCDECKSQEVVNISHRCGLCCHSKLGLPTFIATGEYGHRMRIRAEDLRAAMDKAEERTGESIVSVVQEERVL